MKKESIKSKGFRKRKALNQNSISILNSQISRNYGSDDSKDNLLSSKAEQSNKIKLLKRLDKYSLHVDEMPQQINISRDQIAFNLSDIQQAAKRKGFVQIQRKANYLLGKRLIKLEIQNKKKSHYQKLCKKQKMEEQFFKQKKIKRFDYEKLVKQKLMTNSFIIRPYQSGKGFVQSDIYEGQYENIYTNRLQQCQYIEVARQVNKIFMNNFSYGSVNSGRENQADTFSKICLVCCLFLLIMVLIEINVYSQALLYSIFIISCIILALAGFISIRNYFEKPNDNNQFQQTLEDVNNYFDKLNNKNQNFKWSYPQNLMYLEVHFQDDRILDNH